MRERFLPTLLRWVTLGSVLLTAWFPCVWSESFLFPYVSVKGHLFRVLVAVAVACWAVLAVLRRPARPRSSPIFLSLVAFVALLGVADVFGCCPVRSLLGNLERMEGWFTHVHLLGYFVVLSVILSSERLWCRLAQFSLAASVVVTAVALSQLVGWQPTDSVDHRLEGTLGNPSFLAAYLGFHLWLVAYFLVRHSSSTLTRLALGGIATAEGVALFFTATRSAMLGVVLGGLVAAGLLLAQERQRMRLRRSAAILVVGILVVVTGVVILRRSSALESVPVLWRFVAVSPSDLTSRARLLAWRAALDGAVERPWLGWGEGNYGVVYTRHYDPRFYDQEPFFDRAHNVFLEWLVAGGVPVLLAYCAILASFLGVVWRTQHFDPVERSLFTGLATGYVVHTSLLFDSLTSFVLGIGVLAYVHWRVVASRPRPAEPAGGGRRLGWALLAVPVVATAVVSLGLTWRTVVAERALVTGLRLDPRGPAGNLESFRRALRNRTPATPEVREKLLAVAVEVARGKAGDAATVGQLTSLAYREMADQIRECPLDLRYRLELASFLRRFSAFAEAERHLELARQLAPLKQQVLFELGSLYLNQGRVDSALESFQAAYNLAPEWKEARNRYAAAAIQVGRRDIAERLLLPTEGTIAIGDDWLIAAFAVTGDTKNLVAALKVRVEAAEKRGEETFRLRAALAEARRALSKGPFAGGFESGRSAAWSRPAALSLPDKVFADGFESGTSATWPVLESRPRETSGRHPNARRESGKGVE